jgi:hypothetical protein
MIYEYQCKHGHITERWRPVAECKEPVVDACRDSTECVYERILSPVPTNFKFADTRSHKG